MQQLLNRTKQAWGQWRNRLRLGSKYLSGSAADIEPIKLQSQSEELSSSLGKSENVFKDGGNLEDGSPYLYLSGTFVNVNVMPMGWLVAFNHCTFTIRLLKSPH